MLRVSDDLPAKEAYEDNVRQVRRTRGPRGGCAGRKQFYDERLANDGDIRREEDGLPSLRVFNLLPPFKRDLYPPSSPLFLPAK